VSHIVQIQTEIRDVTALRAACRRLALPEPQEETVALFSAQATGYAVRLPDWHYPVVCDLAKGTIAFDNFNGSWGAQSELDRLLQSYAVEKASLEARRQGHSVFEQSLPDGSIRLSIQVGGAI